MTYPEAARIAKRRGKVILRIDIDACGRVLDLVVDKSADNEAMDHEAVEAAKTWPYAPSEALEEGAPTGTTVMPGRIYVPVMFGPDAPAYGPGFALRQWKRLHVDANVVADEKGMLPAYIPDSESIAPGTVTDVIAMLEAHGRRVPTDAAGMRRYEMSDGFLTTVWEVFESGFVFAPAVVRTRLATDGRQAFRVKAGLCESKEPEGCAKFEQFLGEGQPQKPLEPPPRPPADALRHYGY